MFGQGIYGCENRKGKGGVASPIDFLCKIEVSKFVTCLYSKKHYKTRWNTTLMNDIIQMIDESSGLRKVNGMNVRVCINWIMKLLDGTGPTKLLCDQLTYLAKCHCLNLSSEV